MHIGYVDADGVQEACNPSSWAAEAEGWFFFKGSSFFIRGEQMKLQLGTIFFTTGWGILLRSFLWEENLENRCCWEWKESTNFWYGYKKVNSVYIVSLWY